MTTCGLLSLSELLERILSVVNPCRSEARLRISMSTRHCLLAGFTFYDFLDGRGEKKGLGKEKCYFSSL